MENTTIPELEVRGISKTFPGTVALDEIDFEVKKGEVHAIVGENGAGKSTLMKILSGAYTKTSGQILIRGKEMEINGISDAQRHGISMIYQELTNLPKLSVAENIFLGVLPKSTIPGVVNFRALYAKTREYFDHFQIEIDAKAKLASLTVAEKQFVEIIKAITAKNARIVIMDEPTSSLTKDEIERLFSIIRELKQQGATIIYISHRLDEIVRIADRVSIFRDGKNRGTLIRGEFDEEKIITLMLGHSLTRAEKQKMPRQDIVFEVKNVNIARRVRNFNMKLYKGEILGIAGLMGSGKDELVKCLFGLWPAISKEVLYKGRQIFIKHPKDAIDLGIVYLPEERKLSSLFLELSVKYNISPIWLFNTYKRFFIHEKQEALLANQFVDRLDIKTPSLLQEVVNLSGGNQQKTVFSRLLAVKPELMILNDPTRGVDVGSKEEIYRIIRELAVKGTSIIIVSSEIEEITYLANRVLVLSKGETRGEFIDEEVTMKNILTCAVRGKENGQTEH